MSGNKEPNFLLTSLIAGGLAGTIVDVVLYPLDTLKTRLQSEKGFINSGGFKNLYKGLTPVVVGSAPTAALFFVTYEGMKQILLEKYADEYAPFCYMGSASFAEMVSCLIRVPVEVLKQRKQALVDEKKRLHIRQVYRGYWSTVLRDMPFSIVQFTIWEYLKKILKIYAERDIFPYEGATCGAIAGSIAAAVTTPLDVVKTRIMLSDMNQSSVNLRIWRLLLSVYRENGIAGLFSGIVPRVTWITIGGFIFFGAYEKSKAVLM